MRPVITEKAVMKIEAENTLTFRFEKGKSKDDIKKDIESLFDIKIKKVRTLVHKNKKIAYVQLKKEFPAMDVATKLGII